MSPKTVSEIVDSEVWVVCPTTPSEVWCEGEFVAAVRTMEVLSPTMTQWKGDRERARLVQCAPEALKMLLELEWTGDSIDCPVCHEFEPRGDRRLRQESAGHRKDCALLAILRKAGLR